MFKALETKPETEGVRSSDDSLSVTKVNAMSTKFIDKQKCYNI